MQATPLRPRNCVLCSLVPRPDAGIWGWERDYVRCCDVIMTRHFTNANVATITSGSKELLGVDHYTVLVMADRRVLLSLLVLAVSAHAFYLPGLAPTNFCRQQVKDKDKNANCKVRICHPTSSCDRKVIRNGHLSSIPPPRLYVLTPLSLSFR